MPTIKPTPGLKLISNQLNVPGLLPRLREMVRLNTCTYFVLTNPLGYVEIIYKEAK